MSQPIFLPPPKTLGLFWPSSQGHLDKANIGKSFFAEAGYQIVKSKAWQRICRGYLAANDHYRLLSLTSLTDAKKFEVDGFLAQRGGYGCTRLLGDIGDWSAYPPQKPLIGFSDVTALHMARYAMTGVGGWHAPMLESIADASPLSRDTFFKALAGQGPAEWNFTESQVIKKGLAKGPVLGGNLSVLWALSGSPYWPNFDGAILLIEDINEPAYRLDRLMTSLLTSGLLERLNGLVFGSFINCGSPILVTTILTEAASHLRPGCPAVKGAPFGHQPIQQPWWIGEEAELEAQAEGGCLRFLER
ncbi:MAG: LD-carboxypeptidase [Deltaproteobacteria bacterium]|jgi:muramoyltetrapeptide carboxypeptidase|nr:LD-carboxypeptidase [Deltaproteobacteria bacterium]